jgi:vacuolar-type H+-ATPase subunit H
MFAFGGILRQFRGGVPGAAVPAGVPVDRRTELESELAPVLALLEPSKHEVERIVADARAEAERRRSVATERALQIIAQARGVVPGEQRRATDAQLAGSAAERRALMDTAQKEADRIDQRARDCVPALVKELTVRLERRLR